MSYPEPAFLLRHPQIMRKVLWPSFFAVPTYRNSAVSDAKITSVGAPSTPSLMVPGANSLKSSAPLAEPTSPAG